MSNLKQLADKYRAARNDADMAFDLARTAVGNPFFWAAYENFVKEKELRARPLRNAYLAKHGDVDELPNVVLSLALQEADKL